MDVNVYKGESDLDDTNDVISEEEENANSQTADLLVKDERIQKIHKQYIHFFQLVTQNTLPKLKDNAAVDSTDFENSKQLYILTDAYQKEFETLSENEKPEYRTTLQKVQNNADQIKKIYAKVKQLAMAQNPKEDDQTIVTVEPPTFTL